MRRLLVQDLLRLALDGIRSISDIVLAVAKPVADPTEDVAALMLALLAHLLHKKSKS